MADTLTEIANLALSEMGEAPISNIDSSTEARANQVNRQLKKTIKSLNGRYRWPELYAQATLSDTGTVDEDNNTLWALPADLIQMVRLVSEYGWRLKGGYLITIDTAPVAEYIQYSAVPSEWSPWFTDAVVALLAANCALSISKDRGMRSELRAEAERIVDESISRAQLSESSSIHSVEGFRYRQARHGFDSRSGYFPAGNTEKG